MAGYKLDTTSKKRPKVRPYSKDMLTRQGNGGNYVLQVRVPEHLRGVPPFGSRVIFKRSLKTKDRAEALKRRDRILIEIGYRTLEEVRLEDRRIGAMKPHEHYFSIVNDDLDPETLFTLRGEVSNQIQDHYEDGDESPLDANHLEKLDAQLAGLDRQIERHISGTASIADIPHPYSIDLETACKNLKVSMEERGRPKKSIAKVDAASIRYRAFVDGNPPIGSIRRQKVMAFIRDSRTKGLSKATVGNDLSYLGQAFQGAIDEGFLGEARPNPFKAHRLEGFAPATEAMRFSDKQLGKLMLLVREDVDLLAAILVGYYTGMRISEIFTSRANRQLEVDVWEVAFDGGKTASAKRLIPIHPALKKVLEKLGRWPVLGQTVPWTTSSADALGKRFGRAKKSLLSAEEVTDQEGYNIHSLRHGFISRLNELDHNQYAIADLSGHSKGGSKTEAARTYIRPAELARRKEIIESIPELPIPQGVF